MRAFAVLLTVSLLAACSDTSQDEAAVTGPDGEVTIDDTDRGDIRITSKDGKSVTVDQRGGNNAQWPEGFDPYPGATVTSDISMGGESGAGKIIAFTTSDAPAEVADYYRERAETAGFEIEMELTVNGGRMLAGERADGTGFAINASAVDGGTSASLTVGRSR